MPLIMNIFEIINKLYFEYIYHLFVSIRIFIWTITLIIIFYILFFLTAFVIYLIVKIIIAIIFLLYAVLIFFIGSSLQIITKSTRIQKFNFFTGDIFEKLTTDISDTHIKIWNLTWKRIFPKSLKTTMFFIIIFFVFLVIISILNFTQYKNLTIMVESQFIKIEMSIFNIDKIPVIKIEQDNLYNDYENKSDNADVESAKPYYTLNDNTDFLNLRDLPSSRNGSVITVLKKGDIVLLLDNPLDNPVENWIYVSTEDGINGWINKNYVILIK